MRASWCLAPAFYIQVGSTKAGIAVIELLKNIFFYRNDLCFDGRSRQFADDNDFFDAGIVLRKHNLC